MGFDGVDTCREPDLILVPRLDHDRAGDISQFDSNVLATGIAFGDLLLGSDACRKGKRREKDTNCEEAAAPGPAPG